MCDSGKNTNATMATGNGISRLVTNLHTLPKRKSLLVIETGFPTSLIDLFIKSSFSKEGKQGQQQKTMAKTKTNNNNRKREKKMPKSRSAIPTPSIRTDPSVAPVVVPPGIETIVDRCDLRGHDGHGIEFRDLGDGDSVPGTNRVVLAVLKVFLAVVLALGTKKLTIGITMSAFLLLFLEYLGKHLSRFQPRIPPTDLISESVASGGDDEVCCRVSSSSSSACASVDEIETVGGSDASGGGAQVGGDVWNASKKGEDWWCRRSGKLRSTLMRRLIPKRLHRGSKKSKDEPEKCMGPEVKALSSPPCEEKDQSETAEEEPLQENAEAVSDGGGEVVVKRPGKGGSGSTLILLLIVISGLLWGRILAFFLAIGWCLLLKFWVLFSSVTSLKFD